MWARSGDMRRPATDAKLTIAPFPCFCMTGSTYLQPRKAVFRLCSICASQTSSLIVTALPGAEPPTLLTRMSMRPNSPTQAATAASTSRASVMSTPRVRQVPPSLSMMALVTSAACLRRSTPKIFAPCRASNTAVALPLPQTLASGSSPTEPAPEMKTTLSLRLSMLVPHKATATGLVKRRLALEDALFSKRSDFAGAHAEPRAQHVLDVLAEQRGGSQLWRSAVEAHSPGRHLDGPGGRMIDRLHNAALDEARIVEQLQRIEDRTRRHACRSKQPHCLLLAVATSPVADDGVDLCRTFAARPLGVVAVIPAQILPPDHL